VEKLVELVQAESFPRMIVKFIWGVEFNWGSTYANNVMTARSAFEGDEPLLIVRADYLFDWRLLHKMARCAFTSTVDAFALIDSARDTRVGDGCALQGLLQGWPLQRAGQSAAWDGRLHREDRAPAGCV